MLRVLLFSQKGAGNHYYGPGMSAYRMYKSKELSDKLSISLAHGHKNQKDMEFFDKQFLISNIEKKSVFSGVKFLIKAKKWVKKNAHSFDVVHCLSAFHHSFMFAFWFEKAGVPSVIKISESKYIGFSGGSLLSNILGLRRFRKKNANSISAYISISSEIRQKLLEAGIKSEKIYNIPNGVNIDRFKPLLQSEKKKLRKKLTLKDKFTVIFTGSFSDRKNPLLIVKAFGEIHNKDNIQLLLVGPDREESDQRDRIISYISEHKIKNVIIKDFQEDIELYYQSSDIFVLPSNQEGLSNSMLEALACGLPAVVTKISGAEDVIDERENGTFIDDDPISIKKALMSYINDPKKLTKHSIGARSTIIENYSSKTILQKHLNLFNSLK
jgi:glycosyltransferase involved in cell wall biosynthesis